MHLLHIINKYTAVFHASVLLVTMNFVIILYEGYLYLNTLKNISLLKKLIKNSQKLFYMFALWEYWSENHLL